MNVLKPCPFCGSKDVEVVELMPAIPSHSFMTVCSKCPASIGAKTEDEAINLWNKRAGNEDERRITKILAAGIRKRICKY